MATNCPVSLLGAVIVVLLCCTLPSMAADPPPIVHKPGHCLWYKQCGPSNNGKYNCFYNGPAMNVTNGSDFQKELEAICPEYMYGPVCCDHDQLKTLSTQIVTAKQLFGRCPACLKNFIKNFCATTCDPDSAQYMDGDLQQVNDTTWEVARARIYLTQEYGDDLFNSCKHVQDPSDNAQKVVDLMCGGASPCTTEAWFRYLGSGNPYVPFPMTYIFGDKNYSNGIVPKSAYFYPCNYSGDNYALQCSCSDCGTPDVCPPPPNPPANTFPTGLIMVCIAGVGGVITLLIFIAALIAGIIQVIMKPNGYSRIGSKKLSKGGYGAMLEDDNDSPTNSIGSINDDELQLDAEFEDEANCCCYGCAKMGAYFERAIKRAFYLWGKFVTRFWYIILIAGVILVGVLASGMYRFKIVTDTVELWSAPTSRARIEKNYFDKNFGPFYRTEMIIIKPKNTTAYFQAADPNGNMASFGPALQFDVLNETFHLQDHLIKMQVPYQFPNGTMKNVTIEDICFQPLYPDNQNCTIMSVINYFQNDYNLLTVTDPFTQDLTYPNHIYFCARDPASPAQTNADGTAGTPCLGSFGGPVDPNVALGGFNFNDEVGQYEYQNASTLIITFTVNNHVNEKDNAMAEAWEKAYLDYLKSYNGSTFNISFLAERSAVDELERESQTDELTVLISYLFMFAYITLFLGHIRSVATVLIDMKFFVGFVGVLLVLGAVVAAIGLLSYIGVAGSLIILEVVPFLVLAVGVDNLFIIVHSYERQAKKFARLYEGDLSKIPIEELIGRAIGEVAPSLLLTSLSETAAFLLGGISSMPAVRAFSFYAGVAVFFNFLLQISVFVAVVALDARRQLANRFDILFCLKLKGKFNPNSGVDILHFIMKWFAKFILYPLVRPFVLLLFGATTTMALVFLFKLDIGLDQSLAFPKDSYLIQYFTDMPKYLHAGSPVYFVVKEGPDYSLPDVQNKICSQAGCDKNSLGTQISVYAEEPNLTHIAEPGMLWVDTYFQWISPASGCCGVINGTDHNYCPNPGKDKCVSCLPDRSDDRPTSTEFTKHIREWLIANPDKDCPAGGHAAFGSGVNLDKGDKVTTSYVMTYHTVLKDSEEYVDAIYWARKLSDNVTQHLNLTVFPYSVFYVFYEQYLHTVHDMALNLGVSISAVFVVTFLTMGLNFWAAFIIILCVGMIIVHMLGCMALSGISANAVSLVNLVMTVGISVEFCSHIVRWFTSCSLPTRYLRARSALANMGASVVSGITVTKFLGVFVLLFAKSQLFEIYYFRMYMFMLLWGALVGLVFLPVLLSYVGPPYCPVKNIPSPYDPSLVPSQQENNNTTTTFSPKKEPSPPAAPNQYSSQYPTLPTANEVENRINSTQQQYPGATYPGQNEYQRRGIPYDNSANETTRLINT